MMLQTPIFRWGVGLAGALTVAAVASLFLDGTAQLVAYGIAVVDAVATPIVLKRAARS